MTENSDQLLQLVMQMSAEMGALKNQINNVPQAAKPDLNKELVTVLSSLQNNPNYTSAPMIANNLQSVAKQNLIHQGSFLLNLISLHWKPILLSIIVVIGVSFFYESIVSLYVRFKSNGVTVQSDIPKIDEGPFKDWNLCISKNAHKFCPTIDELYNQCDKYFQKGSK